MTDEQKQATRQRIGQRITALRKMQGMTITELAELAGVGRGHLSKIEAGHYAVTLETIEAIAEALGMTVDIVDERLRDLAPLRVMTVSVTAEPRSAEKRIEAEPRPTEKRGL